jgi:hypothetical protein
MTLKTNYCSGRKVSLNHVRERGHCPFRKAAHSAAPERQVKKSVVLFTVGQYFLPLAVMHMSQAAKKIGNADAKTHQLL